MLPLHLVLVRHGQSEGNTINKLPNASAYAHLPPNFFNRHTTHLRLTEKGKDQTKATSDWLKQQKLDCFDGYYVSEYARAMETAALLGLPDAIWEKQFQLRERVHGLVEGLPDHARQEQFPRYMELHKLHALYSPWPDGESMTEVCDRLNHNIISTLHRDMASKRVIIVSHGDVMRAFRVILEQIPADTYHEVENQKHFMIGNGQVIHYTRINPEDPTHILPHLGWVRSVNPYDPDYAGHDWQPIVRKKYTNAELLVLAQRSPRLVEG